MLYNGRTTEQFNESSCGTLRILTKLGSPVAWRIQTMCPILNILRGANPKTYRQGAYDRVGTRSNRSLCHTFFIILVRQIND